MLIERLFRVVFDAMLIVLFGTEKKCGKSSPTAEAAYVYYKTSSMVFFTLLQKLTSGFSGLIGFGTSVSINFNRVIVGAPYYNGGPYYGWTILSVCWLHLIFIVRCRKFVRGYVCVYRDCGKSLDAVGNCVSSQRFERTVRISDVFELLQ